MNTLTEIEVKEVSSRHVHAADKWLRMYAGISSNLERYQDGIMYLRIDNTEKQFPSDVKTAKKLAECWKRNNSELADAEAFVALFYSSGSTGFVLGGSDLFDHDKIGRLVDEFHETNKQVPKLISLFSERFDHTITSDADGQGVEMVCRKAVGLEISEYRERRAKEGVNVPLFLCARLQEIMLKKRVTLEKALTMLNDRLCERHD